MDSVAKRTVAEMIGESLRGAGVLVFVFLWFERLIGEKTFSHSALAITTLSFSIFLAVGIIIERRR